MKSEKLQLKKQKEFGKNEIKRMLDSSQNKDAKFIFQD